MDPIPIDSIIRTKRKTVSLIITPDAKLVVRAPLHTSDAYIEKLVLEKGAWIRRKITELRERPVPGKRNFVDGEEFFFLGKKYQLKIVDHLSPVTIAGEYLLVPGTTGSRIQKLVTEWYKREAGVIFGKQCSSCAKIVGKVPVSIRISTATRRWGSCSTRGTLCFSWRLVIAPPEIIDYVIVHELVHLIHHNHSKRFWNAVGTVMPDYRERKKWLKVHERMLTI